MLITNMNLVFVKNYFPTLKIEKITKFLEVILWVKVDLVRTYPTLYHCKMVLIITIYLIPKVKIRTINWFHIHLKLTFTITKWQISRFYR